MLLTKRNVIVQPVTRLWLWKSAPSSHTHRELKKCTPFGDFSDQSHFQTTILVDAGVCCPLSFSVFAFSSRAIPILSFELILVCFQSFWFWRFHLPMLFAPILASFVLKSRFFFLCPQLLTLSFSSSTETDLRLMLFLWAVVNPVSSLRKIQEVSEIVLFWILLWIQIMVRTASCFSTFCNSQCFPVRFCLLWKE